MKKELVYVNSGNPAFATILANSISLADTDDYVGFYAERDGKKYCFGSHDMMLPNSLVVAFGDDQTTPEPDNFNYGEEMHLFMYDAQTDKFYDIIPGMILKPNPDNMYQYVQVDTMKFYPLSLYSVVGASLGKEITLEINNELTQVVLEPVNHTTPIKSNGDEKIAIEYSAKNVTDPMFFVALGSGYVKKIGLLQIPYYFFTPSDKNVIINIVANDIFSQQLITKQVKFVLDQSAESNIVWENDYGFLYTDADTLKFKAKQELVVEILRKDSGTWKRTVYGKVNKDAVKPVVNGNLPRWKGAEFQIKISLLESKKIVLKDTGYYTV